MSANLPGVEEAVDAGKRAILGTAGHAWGAGEGQVGAEILCEPAARAVVDALLELGWTPPPCGRRLKVLEGG